MLKSILQKLLMNTEENNQVILLTIPPYSPFLNPWEKLILKIKSSIKVSQRNGKLISFRSFKAVVDRFDIIAMRNWIRESREETFNYIKTYVVDK